MNQVLVIGSSKSGKLTLVESIFEKSVSSLPENLESHSGLILDDLKVTNKYMETIVGIWVDEYNKRDEQPSVSGFKEWCDELLSDELEEVREAIKGIIFTFHPRDPIEYIEKAAEQLTTLVDELFGDDWSGIKLAVAIEKSVRVLDQEELLRLEDIWLPNGFEFVWFEEPNGDMKNGVDRVKEIFENNQWSTEPTGKEYVPDNKDIDQMFTRLLDDYDETKEPDVDYEVLVDKLKLAKLQIGSLGSEEERIKLAQEAVLNVFKLM